MVRQDPRYRGPEEGKDAKRTYSIKAGTSKMSWSCYKNAHRKFSMEYFRTKSALKEAKRNATKIPLKSHLRISIFRLTQEQVAQDRTKWRCLKKGTAQKRNRNSVTKNRQQKNQKELLP